MGRPQSGASLVILIHLYRTARMGPAQNGGPMDEKTITAVSTSLALMQIQVNALLLLLERHTPGVPIKEEFQQLISEGVQTVGLETMEGIKSRIYEGIVQQEEKDRGNGHH
jgi:hypothetical protein